MAADTNKEIVVPAERASFWMDRWGNWCNRHGRFEHKKIIAYFHAAIGRDASGYFVSQINGEVREKVYFRYEDTALFVFDVLVADDLILVLNTGRRIALDPGALFIRDDALYMRDGDERIKFNATSMLKLNPYIEGQGEKWYLYFQGQRFPIPAEGLAIGSEGADRETASEGGATPEMPGNSESDA